MNIIYVGVNPDTGALAFTHDKSKIHQLVDVSEYALLSDIPPVTNDSNFVKGMLRCPKCKFVLYSRILYTKSGTVGNNNKSEDCMNGCGPMWKVDKDSYINELIESMNKLVLENNELKLSQKNQ